MHMDLFSCKGTMIIPYQTPYPKRRVALRANVTVKVTYIQCTACPPVKRAGDFNRLKIEAVLPSSICESKPKPIKKAGNKTQTTIGLFEI